MAKSKKKQLKTFIKFLALSKNPVTTRAVVKDAPDNVIKAICNAGLNCYQGAVKLKPSARRILSKHRNIFKHLVSKTKSIKQKRQLLQQKGGAAFIPIILAAALSFLGQRLLQ